MPHAIPTDPDHLLELSRTMRKADREELMASSGQSPLEALEEGYVLSSKLYTIFNDEDRVVGVFGVAPNPLDPTIGHPWMLASDLLDGMKMTFLRQCHSYVDDLGKGYLLLMNVCDKRNTVHIKWLRWLGFTFIREHPHYGVGRLPFLEFVKIGDDPCVA